MMTSSREIIIKKYLGIPFQHLGRNPDKGLDCWGFIKCVYLDAGIALSDLDAYAPDWARRGQNFFLKNYSDQWARVEQPRFMDIVLIRTAGLVNHAGFVLDEAQFIHCCRAGVVVSTIAQFAIANKIAGYYRFKNDQDRLFAQPVRETGRT